MSQANAKRLSVLTAGAAGLLSLAGCMVGPDFKKPHMDMPANWQSPLGAPTTQPSTPTTREMQVVQWWATFNDPELNSLITRALESNLSLKQAESRIRQARANRGVVAANLWPTANAVAGYRHSWSGGGSSSGFTTGGTGTGGTGGTGTGGTGTGGTGGTGASGASFSSGGGRDLWQVGLDATWELDVFGGIRRQVEAADANIVFAIEDRRDVFVTLVSEVALNYIQMRGFQQQVIIAQRNLEAQRQSADLTRRRQIGGLVSALDVANADAQVASTLSTIPNLESQAQQAIFSLSLLLGLQPAALAQELSTSAGIPTTPPEVPVGLPSELLRRRPDIRRAEAALHAATANVGVATAQLYPAFSLTGAVGTSSNRFLNLGNWDNGFWSIGPSASWNLFDAGRIRSQIKVENELQEQSLLAWQNTVLTALHDVEVALVAYVQEQQRRKALIEAVAANRQAVNLSLQLYRQGQTDFLNVLNAQRSLFASEDFLTQSTANVATNLVALYKSLGGGWETELLPPAAPTPTTRPTTMPTTRP